MSDFEFFYADVDDTLGLINQYHVEDWVHANNGVVTSGLRGGLLSNCNIRFSFIPQPQRHLTYRPEDLDYKNLKMYVFDEDLLFQVLDKYQIGNVAQILMSPVNNIEEYGLTNIITAARADFDELYIVPPIDALNNSAWKRRIAKVPGIDSKNSPKKGFLTMFWK